VAFSDVTIVPGGTIPPVQHNYLYCAHCLSCSYRRWIVGSGEEHCQHCGTNMAEDGMRIWGLEISGNPALLCDYIEVATERLHVKWKDTDSKDSTVPAQKHPGR
jgi:hypothetical protein